MTRTIGLTIAAILLAVSLSAQVRFKLELLPDDATYRISLVPDVTWVFPQNLTASAQVTIRVPHAPAPFGFEVGSLVSVQPGTEWDDNVRVYAPVEAPTWDYISFGLISGATGAFNYMAGVDIPLFEFNNAAESCIGKIELINNDTDPFLPPNSVGANIAQSITVIGGGLMNAYWGIIGDAEAPCLPNPPCTVNVVGVPAILCHGDLHEGQLYQNDTVLVAHYLSFSGCDSIVSTNIEVLETSMDTLFLTRCEGAVFNGIPIWQDTLISSIFENIHGCDSLVFTRIDAVDFYSENQFAQVCEGSIFAGIPVYSDTMIVVVLTATTGCDSIVNTAIDVVAQFETVVDTQVCVGNLFNGAAIFADTILIENLQSTFGCDSIVQINITTNPLPKPVILLEQSDCEYSLFTGNFASYQWSTNETTNEIPIFQAGQYSLTVTDGNGCTGLANFQYLGNTNISAEITVTQPNCGVNSKGRIEISNIAGGSEPYLFSINGGNDFSPSPIFEGLAAGIYPIVVEDAFGCAWAQEITIQEKLEVQLRSDYQQFINLGENAKLEVLTNQTYDSISWQPTTGLSCPNCPETLANPIKNTNYRVTVFASNGCTQTLDAWVMVDQNGQVFVPNSFSPNGDGINDYFIPFIGPSVKKICSMIVFERQGGQVFQAEDLAVNITTAGWDGTWRGQLASEGVYVYAIEIELISGEVELISGEVSIIK